MMDNNDQRLTMNDINGQSVLMGDIQLLPNMSTIVMDDHSADQLMQLLGTQNYMIPDGSHLTDNQRTVTAMDSVNAEHHSIAPMDRHSVESCNYVSNQFEPQYHDSPDSRYKYRSSGLSTVAETVTHVSETDSISGQSYASVGNPGVTNIGVPQNYQLNSLNNWSHNQNHNNHSLGGQQQSRAPKDLLINANLPTNHSHQKVTPHSAYIPRQRMSNFATTVPSMNPSTTSTPVNQTHNNLIAVNNNNNSIDNRNVGHNKNSVQVLNEGSVQTRTLDSPTVTKRTVIIFKVVDQIVDNNGKVIKESVIKNEEIVKNFGKIDWNESITTPLSSIGSKSSRFASHPSSAVLADVSSSVRSTSSVISSEGRTNQNNESLTKRHSIINEDLNKVLTPLTSIPPNPVIDTNYNKVHSNDSFTQNLEIRTTDELATACLTQGNATNSLKSIDLKADEPKINERDEEERRETATALLSLTQRSVSLNIDCNTSDQLLPNFDYSIKPGNRVMAKWRDKNFYPAVISKQLQQNNKWSVTFEDKATRSLFENEMIQLSRLVDGQDVMVTISDGFCAKATVKGVVCENNELYFDLEHLKDDKLVVKRYPLKDLFLNVEQGALILTKAVKPAFNGAVFADVDLDNIVSGKRSRIALKPEQLDKPSQSSQFKNGKRRAVDEVSVDVDYDENEDDIGSPIPVKPKKKCNNARANKKRVESHYTHFNSEHSLSISPRTSKVHTSMPPNELIKLLGPLPEAGSRIFERVSFLLTCGDRNKCDDLSVEQSNPERSTPFDKLYLIKQIETGAGKVFDTFEEMKIFEDNIDQVLIADTYHRSIKYIQCLAAGISIASHLWVIDCCRQNKYLKRDNYTLPAGFSIITNALPSDKNTFKKSSTLFKGNKFYFGSKDPEKLHRLWAPVLSAAQAVIVDHNEVNVSNLSRKTVDIIIGDPSCSIDLVKKASDAINTFDYTEHTAESLVERISNQARIKSKLSWTVRICANGITNRDNWHPMDKFIVISFGSLIIILCAEYRTDSGFKSF